MTPAELKAYVANKRKNQYKDHYDVLHAPDKNCAVLSRLQLWTAAPFLVVITLD